LWSEFKRTYFKIGNSPNKDIDITFRNVGKCGAISGVISWRLSERGYNEGLAFWGNINK